MSYFNLIVYWFSCTILVSSFEKCTFEKRGISTENFFVIFLRIGKQNLQDLFLNRFWWLLLYLIILILALTDFHPVFSTIWCYGLRFTKNSVILLKVRLHVTETKSHPGINKFLFTREFHPGMKRVEFHPGMKFNLKGNLPLSMKTYNEIYQWYVKTSDDYFFRKVTLFIIFVCLFSY